MAPSDLHRAAAQPTVPATQPRVEWVVVPDHELVGRIGQGSYGEVWLARELKRCRRLPFEECVQLGLALSSALSHMHQRGLVHRDVKPSNILYVGGVPKLGDMGLVGEVGESASYVGTEGYIPPEGAGTPRADVFGLGKVLYEAGTGQDRLEFPLLPGGLGEGPAEARLVELNEVFLKACAPDPGQRYKTAEGVAR
jgi:serine/threonine protein kinase